MLVNFTVAEEVTIPYDYAKPLSSQMVLMKSQVFGERQIEIFLSERELTHKIFFTFR